MNGKAARLFLLVRDEKSINRNNMLLDRIIGPEV